MKRRDALRTVAASSAAAAIPTLLLPLKSRAAEPAGGVPDLVAVRNGEPADMLAKGLESIGGMGRFVSKGQSVVVKPNIGWARSVKTGANTNPDLVKAVVKACLAAGASKVYVFDHTVAPWAKCYEMSGIQAAAKEAGAIVVPGSEEKHYGKVAVPGGDRLKEVEVHELVAESDVLINVPVLKHHIGARATIAMKNLMGTIWDRRAYHRDGLQQCIADFCLYRKPDLNIVDAYRITMDNGPQRARPADVILTKALLMSPDIVAVDSAAVRYLKATPEEAEHISLAAGMGLGQMDLEALKIQRIAL